MSTRPVTILLVEDNPDHTELIRRSLQKYQVAITLQHVADGEAALDYLFQRGDPRSFDPLKYSRPDVILLDLRLPKVDGLEVLKEIKCDQELRHIPVVILTSSETDRDLVRAYDNYVNSYLVKPLDFDKFSKLMNELGFYWLGLNRHP